MFWFFGYKACWILAPWPGIESTPLALEGKVLTTGPPGMVSLDFWPYFRNLAEWRAAAIWLSLSTAKVH